jgi:hypothetical protein
MMTDVGWGRGGEARKRRRIEILRKARSNMGNGVCTERTVRRFAVDRRCL